MKPERLVALKQQALTSVAARAKNKNAPGISMVAISPHELLELLLTFEQVQRSSQVDSERSDSALT